MDDEETFAHERSGEYGLATFSVDLQSSSGSGKMQNDVTLGEGWKDDSTREALVEGRNIERIIIMGLSRPPKEIKDDASNPIEFEFDATTKILIIKKPGVSALSHWSLVFEF